MSDLKNIMEDNRGSEIPVVNEDEPPGNSHHSFIDILFAKWNLMVSCGTEATLRSSSGYQEEYAHRFPRGSRTILGNRRIAVSSNDSR